MVGFLTDFSAILSFVFLTTSDVGFALKVICERNWELAMGRQFMAEGLVVKKCVYRSKGSMCWWDSRFNVGKDLEQWKLKLAERASPAGLSTSA